MRVKEFQKLPMSLNIYENAIFVADSHFNEQRNELAVFLEKLQNSSIKTSQLFLMGDMFDFLAGDCKYFIKRNQNVINLINELSKTIEIIYLEGNHDYNLEIIFPNVKIISRNAQPLFATYNDQTVALSHGDIFVNDKFYDIYCGIIRNRPLLKFLNMLDIGYWMSKKIYYALMPKKICRTIGHFESIVKNRIKHYNNDIIIEGHFHQGNEYVIENQRYKNISSLTCSKEYTVLQNGSFIGVSIE